MPVADVPALGEVAQEQRLHHGVLDAFDFSEPDQKVGVEGVRRSLDPVEGEEAEKITKQIYASPPDLIRRAKAVLE